MKGFFDIDTILMEEELLPCTASIDVVNMGFLDKEQNSEHLRQGTKVELPLWLARTLHERGGQPGALIGIDVPKSLTEPYLELLEADATVVNLKEWCTYYFAFAMAYFRMLDTDSPAVQSVIKAFAQRYQVVSDLAQNSLKGDSSDKTRRLDSLEDSLFRLGVKSDQQFQRWLRRRSHIITIVPSADRPPPKRSRLFSLND